jgi:hypothetical protein
MFIKIKETIFCKYDSSMRPKTDVPVDVIFDMVVKSFDFVSSTNLLKILNYF